MTQTITVQGRTYTVAREADGELWVYSSRGNLIGMVYSPPANVTGSPIIVGLSTAKRWPARINQQAARDALAVAS